MTGRLLPLFAAGFALGYWLAVPFGLELFRYYPALGEFSLAARTAADAGPPILWYGWMGCGVVCGIAACVLGFVTPRRLDRAVWPALSWALPLLAALALAWHARVWFL